MIKLLIIGIIALAVALTLLYLLWWAVKTIGAFFGLPLVVIIAIFIILLLVFK